MLQQKNDRNLGNLHLPGSFPIDMMLGFMRQASVVLVKLAGQAIFRYTLLGKVQAYLAANLTVTANDGRALAEAVLRMYRISSSEREAMGASARLYYAQHFSHEMLVDQLVDFLQSARNQRQRESR